MKREVVMTNDICPVLGLLLLVIGLLYPLRGLGIIGGPNNAQFNSANLRGSTKKRISATVLNPFALIVSGGLVLAGTVILLFSMAAGF